MYKNKAVFLDIESVHRGDLDLSNLRASLPNWDFHAFSEPAEIRERILNASVVVANKALLDRDALAAAQGLRLICIAATGVNNIDLQAAARQGISVCNVRDYATQSVVQHVFSLILTLTTQLNAYQQAIKAGLWQKSQHFCLLDYPVHELAGKTLGIIGYGVLGHAIAAIAAAFGMHVMVAERKGQEPRPGRSSFDEVLKAADIVTLHCPLNKQTKGLIGPSELEQMKASSLLINAARGGIVEEAALAKALKEKQIAGAGIDVLSVEPPCNGNVLLDIDLPNFIVTPHIAWASLESRQRLIDEVATNIKAFLRGQPRNLVTDYQKY